MFEKGDIMETIRNVDVNRLHDFKNHPFKVEMNTELCELMRSIEKEGVLVPLLVRTNPYGDGYEVISEHKRKEAAIWTGETKVPVVVRELNYATRRRKEILAQLQEKQRKLIATFALPNTPQTPEEYHAFYRSFDQMPFAFTDIEMVFNEDRHAVDWIFRYGNEKLAEVERVPLTGLIGNTFGSIFSNMDDKWLCTYERATLYGERLEIMAYSPEIDTELKIICFPTFSGHCGCMLFPVDEIHCVQKQDELSQIWKNYLLKQE